MLLSWWTNVHRFSVCHMFCAIFIRTMRCAHLHTCIENATWTRCAVRICWANRWVLVRAHGETRQFKNQLRLNGRKNHLDFNTFLHYDLRFFFSLHYKRKKFIFSEWNKTQAGVLCIRFVWLKAQSNERSKVCSTLKKNVVKHFEEKNSRQHFFQRCKE